MDRDIDALMVDLAEENGFERDSPDWVIQKYDLEYFFIGRGLFRRKRYTEAEIDVIVDAIIPLDYLEYLRKCPLTMENEVTHLIIRRAMEKAKLMRKYRSVNMIDEEGAEDLPELTPRDVEEFNEWHVPLNGEIALRRRLWRKQLNEKNERYEKCINFHILHVFLRANAINAFHHEANIVVAYVACDSCVKSKAAYKDENNGNFRDFFM